MKLTTLFLARTIESWAKWILDSERTLKIKVRSRCDLLNYGLYTLEVVRNILQTIKIY